MSGDKKILVTGGGGFLGAVLTALLLQDGYEVVVLDRFFFGKKLLKELAQNPRCVVVQGDTRTCPENIFEEVQTVMDLAALANDLLSEIDRQLTLDINCKARIRIAALAKKAGVKKYILASSCSVYGRRDGWLTEKSETAPLSTYARACLSAEEGVLPLADNNFSVTALRQGTLYGISPRMRFDLVVNTMTLSIFKNKEVSIRGGEQWRPLLCVNDAARAFIKVMESPIETTNGQIFNVGSTDQNIQIETLAQKMIKSLDKNARIVITESKDERSYRVNCDKIKNSLGYTARENLFEQAQKIYSRLTEGTLADSPQTKTFEWYKGLLTKNPDALKALSS